MSQSPVNVTYSIEEVLKDITQKLEKLDDKVDNLTVEVVTVKTRLETELPAIKADINTIKSSQIAQIWTLIGILGTALVGTVGRFVITALQGNH